MDFAKAFPSPLVVLARAGAVRDGNRPVKILSVKTRSVRRSPFERYLSAQQTLITVLVRWGPVLVVLLRTRHA